MIHSHPMIVQHGNPSRPRRQRLEVNKLVVFVLRFECVRCGARAVLNVTDVDVLWSIGVEVPAVEMST